jgi:hypothetical protein
MSDTPETIEAVERWQQGKINIFDEMARLETERDEARIQYHTTLTLAEVLANTQVKLKAERDGAREKLSHAQALLAEMQDALKLAVKQLLGKKDA